MYQLSQNEDKQEKLFEELRKAMSKKDSRITPTTIEQLPYLKACIKETLRMYPVVLGNGRNLQSDAVICGYNVPKGVSITRFCLCTGCSFRFSDSRHFPTLRFIEQGRVLPGSEQIHPREVAEKRGRLAERHPPFRQPAFWIRPENVHRKAIR